MKAVVGVDPFNNVESLYNLLGRLRIPNLKACCASYAPLPYAPSGLDPNAYALQQRILNEQRELANRALDWSARQLERFGISSESTFDSGSPATRLALAADESKADLLAIASGHEGALRCFLLGSVGRSLTLSCPCSLLIAKGVVEPDGPLKALFAYDGSPYCDSCVEELIRVGPKGIGHIDVLIVDTPNPNRSPVTDLRGEGAYNMGAERRCSLLLEYAGKAANRLRSAGFDADPLCLSGHVNDVIRGVVVDHRIDLTIVGSKGHGWLERTLFGSVALAQAVSEPHSLLILHPRIDSGGLA